MNEVRSAEVSGVRTLWIDAPRPFTAALMFRVGTFDERLATRGVTHLVEHLALSVLKDVELEFNGAVEGLKTVFHTSGEPGEVGRFLGDVCRSLHDLPLQRLDVESGVLEREASMTGGAGFAGEILDAYFGPPRCLRGRGRLPVATIRVVAGARGRRDACRRLPPGAPPRRGPSGRLPSPWRCR
jgi:hypothetical protein